MNLGTDDNAKRLKNKMAVQLKQTKSQNKATFENG